MHRLRDEPCIAPGPSSAAELERVPDLGRALDSFVEAQVHGAIRLDEDALRLVVDPSFRNSRIEDLLTSISARYRIPLDWHPGFALAVEQVPEAFRGYATRALARRIAGNNAGQRLTAATIGAAADSFWRNPHSWRDLGSVDEALTCFRRLWHVLVLYGEPLQRESRPL
jgi:hypothetical protein